MKTLKIILVIFCYYFTVGCGSQTSLDTIVGDSPTSGKVTVSIDESMKMLLDTEIYTFTSLYDKVKVKTQYKPEGDAITDLLTDSAKVIVTCRKLTEKEIKSVESQDAMVKTTQIAFDGLALIVNKENKDTLLSYKYVQNLFNGNITTWKQIFPSSKLGDITVIFDNPKSANARYIMEKYGIKQFPKNCFTASTNAEVISEVAKRKNAIGIISVNWISDKDDKAVNKFLETINVMHITSEIDPDGQEYYGPYPAYIANTSYPLRREVYIISREVFAGPGTGLTSFIAGEIGQRIVLKAGLVPATMPIRLINTKKQL